MIVFLLIILVALCCIAAFCPMPRPLQIGLWVASAIVVLLIVLWAAGLLGVPYGTRPVVVSP